MNEKKETSLGGRQLVDAIIAAAEEKLAEKIVVVDLKGQSVPADFFIICQSDTTVQNSAIADSIIDACAAKNTRPWHYEGGAEGRWIVVDFTDVVVHIMLPELRRYYDLESLWSGQKNSKS